MHVATVWLQYWRLLRVGCVGVGSVPCFMTPLPTLCVLPVATGALLVFVAAVTIQRVVLPESLEASGVLADRVAAVGSHHLDHLQGKHADWVGVSPHLRCHCARRDAEAQDDVISQQVGDDPDRSLARDRLRLVRV